MRLPLHDRRCTCETCIPARGLWQPGQSPREGVQDGEEEDDRAPAHLPLSPSPTSPPPPALSVPHVSSSELPLPWETWELPQPAKPSRDPVDPVAADLANPSNERMSPYHAPATLPAMPVVPDVRMRVRHSFDVFADQLLSLREITLAREAHAGHRVRLGDVVQEALDAFIARSTTDLFAAPAAPDLFRPPGQPDPQHPQAPPTLAAAGAAPPPGAASPPTPSPPRQPEQT